MGGNPRGGQRHGADLVLPLLLWGKRRLLRMCGWEAGSGAAWTSSNSTLCLCVPGPFGSPRQHRESARLPQAAQAGGVGKPSLKAHHHLCCPGFHPGREEGRKGGVPASWQQPGHPVSTSRGPPWSTKRVYFLTFCPPISLSGLPWQSTLLAAYTRGGDVWGEGVGR